ncbi:MAG: replicative DNA helicase [Alphaproteobacteria bacterium]|nr:replicative DNA helicase [Alphaproteobacteria bacterium]
MEAGLIVSNVTPLRDGPAYRAPPHNEEAEQALIGAILVNNHAFQRVSEIVEAEHFANPIHGRIFSAAAKLIERGQIADPVTLRTYFEQDGALTEVGGAAYLARLAAASASIINAEHYAAAIRDLHLRRELIALGEDVVNTAFDAAPDVTAMAQVESAEQRLFNLATTGVGEGGFRTFESALVEAIRMAEAAFKRSGHVAGVATGFIDMDKRLGGLHPSDLVILAGRPAMGKTALATNIAFHAARHYRETRRPDGTAVAEDGAVVAFFSLEMSAEQLATRILAEVSGVPSDQIRRGDVRAEEFPKFVEASQTLAAIPMFIDDTPALTISAIRTRARRLARQRGLGMIVVDYLQLLRPSTASRNENRVQEISEITRGLKAIAKELNVPVLALSQLSRAVEQREDKHPQLADLRESGSIEQDADVVMFVFREEYYLRNEPMRRPDETEDKFNDRYQRWSQRLQEVADTAEVIIAKQRHGPTGTVRLRFDGRITKFDNLVEDDHLPDVHR